MTDSNDPLDDLKRAWRELDPPAPDDDLDRQDSETRAVVNWMKTAWDELEPPAVSAPTATLTRFPDRRQLLRVAALILATIGIGWIIAASEKPSTDAIREPERTGIERTEAVEENTGPNEGNEMAAIEAEIGDQGIVMRSGAVRLILLDTSATKTQSTPQERSK